MRNSTFCFMVWCSVRAFHMNAGSAEKPGHGVASRLRNHSANFSPPLARRAEQAIVAPPYAIAESGVEPTGRRVGCKMTSTSQRAMVGPHLAGHGPALPDGAEVLDGGPRRIPNPLCGVFLLQRAYWPAASPTAALSWRTPPSRQIAYRS